MPCGEESEIGGEMLRRTLGTRRKPIAFRGFASFRGLETPMQCSPLHLKMPQISEPG